MYKRFTDGICIDAGYSSSAEMIIAERKLYKLIKAHTSKDEYLVIENELYDVLALLEKEFFHYGFIEGVKFLTTCMNAEVRR